MAAPSSEGTKTVPKRNDPKKTGLYRNTGGNAISGEDPDFVYQTFSENPDSPGYIGNRLQDHEYGPRNGWQQVIQAWEPVHSQTDAKVRAMDPRTDQGKPIDTVKRYGRQIYCRLPKSEFAKYQETDRKNQEERESQLMKPDRLRGAQASMTALVMQGDHDEMARTQALINAGHPIPGVRAGQ